MPTTLAENSTIQEKEVKPGEKRNILRSRLSLNALNT
jgi:hypothetical protein